MLVIGCAGVAQAARPVISPAAGTPAASPETSISVLGVAPGRIKSVRAVGKESGEHEGRMRRFSGKRGAAFVPADPFVEGELVRAVVRLRGLRTRRFSFTIANLGEIPPAIKLTQTQPDKLQQFVSEPVLVPPRITVLRPAPSLEGSIFLTPLPSPVVHPGEEETITISPVGPGGPMIIDKRGRLVWFRQLTPPTVAANLRIQRYRGRRVLTWWEGPVTLAAFGLGRGVIADTSYRTVATVRAGNGYEMDLHEFELTPEGDALFTIYWPVMVHLPGTPAGTLSPVLNAILQQVDVRTGLVTWEWHALGHIPLSESYATPGNSAHYDAYRLNSVQALPRNRVLVSARNTSAVYEVDRPTGRVRWTLGGKASDFKLRAGARFWFQHHARRLSRNRISLFDDQAGPPQQAPSSRGLVLKLDMKRRTARVAREYHRSEDTSAQSEGSFQTLPSGNVFVGWGAQPFFSEFAKSGRLIFDARLPEDDGSYRVYRFPWEAAPRTRPALAAQPSPSGAVLYASWNGATEVRRWQVLAGPDADSLAPVATVYKRGFETRIEGMGRHPVFAVRALDRRGETLATSDPVQSP